MIYVKSILAGLLALISGSCVLLVIVVVGTFTYALVHPTPGEGSIGWDPISLWRTDPIVLFTPVLTFSLASSGNTEDSLSGTNLTVSSIFTSHLPCAPCQIVLITTRSPCTRYRMM